MSYEKLKDHIGHKLTVVSYGMGVELSVECEKCNAVLYSEGRPGIELEIEGWEEDNYGIITEFGFSVSITKGHDVWCNYTFNIKLPEDGKVHIIDTSSEDGGTYVVQEYKEVPRGLLNMNEELELEIKGLNLLDKFQEILGNIETELINSIEGQ